jgi:hypothetical protein
MKKITLIYVFSILIVFCRCENPSDCIESSGATITKDFIVSSFARIDIEAGIEVIITEGSEYKVQIQTGENLIENVSVSQDATTLYLKENATCNWVREYGQTKAFITAPNITEIYSKTDRNISSNGILTYPNLKLVALDDKGDDRDGAGTGDFILQISNNRLEIQNNSYSRYYISGNTNYFGVGIYNGDGRVETQNFLAKTINIYHRGSNDIIVNPTDKVEGKLVSTGNVILKNNPPINTLQAFYQGQIFYN